MKTKTRPVRKTVTLVTFPATDTDETIEVDHYVYLATGELRLVHEAVQDVVCSNPHCGRVIVAGEYLTLHGKRIVNQYGNPATINNQPYCSDCVKFYETIGE